MRRVLQFAVAAIVVAVLVVGLSQAGNRSSTAKTPPFDVQKALASLQGAPAPLAALHAQHAQLLDGGLPAFHKRIRALRGHPIVVNKWGSWCGPCRQEFPIFQHVGAQEGKAVAFLGVDGHDNAGDARAFLRAYPVTYPSYADPHEAIARAIRAPSNYPITVFLDRKGQQAFIHQGEYRSVADLKADIRRYLGA